MKKLCLLLASGVVVLAFNAPSAHAVLTFKKAFEAKSKVKTAKTDSQKSLAAAVKKAKCNVCHKGKKKKDHNAYGLALKKFLDKDNFKPKRRKAEPEKVKKEIWDALKKVESMKGDEGPTFGELIKAGNLPAGDLAADKK